MLVVYLNIPKLILLDRIDRASLFTGNGDVDNGMERTDILAFAATYTTVFLDMCLPIGKYDTILRAIGQARACKTAPAGIADKIPVGGTGRTGSTYCSQDRQGGGILEKHLFHIFGKGFHLIVILLDVYAQKGHNPIPDHRPFLVDTTAVRDTFLGNDGKRNFVRILFQCIIEKLLEDFGLDPPLYQRVLIIQFKH
jgi:hypothetical protein